MRSAELNRQAHATLAYLERELRARGYRFGWHDNQCLIVARSPAEAEQARGILELLLTQLNGGFRATELVVKTLPNGFAVTEFALSQRPAVGRRRRRKSALPESAAGQCTKGCVLRR